MTALAPVELRVLTGPNLYFPRPAVKLTLDAGAALDAPVERVLGWQRALRLTSPDGAGLPGSPAREAAVAALAAALVRRAGGRIGRRVPAVAGPGDDRTVIVAFPFRYRGTGEAFGAAVARVFGAITADGADPRRELAAVPAALAGHDPGALVRPRRAHVPVIAVTGTNGKTTTTRLIAHLVKTGGRTPGWSSTDGIFIDGVEVESGDWSGPGGAGRVLDDPRVQVAVTETARGGILLRGVGTAANDVSVVTNISADHLGLLGVHTVQQLAEVKSVVTRITKPDGWTVLNADDPLVLGMRAVTRARPWFYSTDPANPHLAEALAAGGRAITVLDGRIVVLRTGLEPMTVLELGQVPLTLAGASRVNTANVLAATAAALAIGVELTDVREGLRTFTADAAHNSGRLNCYLVENTVAILDLAHNEASLDSLLEVGRSMTAPGGELAVVVGTAGDRPDSAIHDMGVMAATRADRVLIARRYKYLRDREVGEMEALWAAGAADAGVLQAPVFDSEVAALTAALDARPPAGSVITVCALEQRAEMAGLIAERGGHEMSPEEISARVAARG